MNYLDRFLSSMSVLRGKLQLVGTAAMLLASKFEEIDPRSSRICFTLQMTLVSETSSENGAPSLESPCF